MAVRLLIGLIRLYQRFLSPVLGRQCRFEPTCSQYAIDVLRMHGFLRGSLYATWRILRCQPFGTPGYDPAPEPRPRGDSPNPPASRV